MKHGERAKLWGVSYRYILSALLCVVNRDLCEHGLRNETSWNF
jgi:hypothetical protein